MLLAGVIDKDYRGCVGVVMFNFSKSDYQGIVHIIIATTTTNTPSLQYTRGTG